MTMLSHSTSEMPRLILSREAMKGLDLFAPQLPTDNLHPVREAYQAFYDELPASAQEILDQLIDATEPEVTDRGAAFLYALSNTSFNVPGKTAGESTHIAFPIALLPSLLTPYQGDTPLHKMLALFSMAGTKDALTAKDRFIPWMDQWADHVFGPEPASVTAPKNTTTRVLQLIRQVETFAPDQAVSFGAYAREKMKEFMDAEKETAAAGGLQGLETRVKALENELRDRPEYKEAIETRAYQETKQVNVHKLMHFLILCAVILFKSTTKRAWQMIPYGPWALLFPKRFVLNLSAYGQRRQQKTQEFFTGFKAFSKPWMIRPAISWMISLTIYKGKSIAVRKDLASRFLPHSSISLPQQAMP
ncbi:hypothetical protein OAN22_00480 [Alphaproteobacteria bacterium]|nr:hypothetical protein [Alphaproteobacteria bacterium]